MVYPCYFLFSRKVWMYYFVVFNHLIIFSMAAQFMVVLLHKPYSIYTFTQV